MKNLKVWQRFVLMATATILPFALVTYKMVTSIETMGVQFAQQESQGLRYYRPLLGLLKNLQQHRGMEAIVLSGDASFKSRLEASGSTSRTTSRPLPRSTSTWARRCARLRSGRRCEMRRAFFSTAVFADPLPRALPSTPR